jgi:hypothetical protein
MVPIVNSIFYKISPRSKKIILFAGIISKHQSSSTHLLKLISVSSYEYVYSLADTRGEKEGAAKNAINNYFFKE